MFNDLRDQSAIFRQHFDCVVMLSWSDWKTESRSNRYHYASRFAKIAPVVFVQPDLEENTYALEATELPGISILHVFDHYGRAQTDRISDALIELGHIKPLLWIYNPFFLPFLQTRRSALKIYHATENYFVRYSSWAVVDNAISRQLTEALRQVDLLVSVSPAVKHSYESRGGYAGRSIVLNNGCDYDFWTSLEGYNFDGARNGGPPVALYQGGINGRLDAKLLDKLLEIATDWEFWFCGAVSPEYRKQWSQLLRRKNLRHLGKLSPEEIARAARSCTAGIIPFLQDEGARTSLPLKAFEYVACGLPVVTIPIDALQAHRDLFEFATTAGEFAECLNRVAKTRCDEAAIASRLSVARQYSYDDRFKELLAELMDLAREVPGAPDRLNVLILYDPGSTHVPTVSEHLKSFRDLSRHAIFYCPATGSAYADWDLSIFDVVIIHYSIRVSVPSHLTFSFATAISHFGGYKVLFIQDDYDVTEMARRWIRQLGIHAVFTCVPEHFIDVVYPRTQFPHVEFVSTLTGYVPRERSIERYAKPLETRSIAIGYRGRTLPYWYGRLGREKYTIGMVMKRICAERGIAADIECDEDKRIYGTNWYEFLGNCRATLGSESGANVFDDLGEIRRSIESALKEDPNLSFEDAHRLFIGDREGAVVMNQLSPKLFESIALRTALILFDGSYSDILKPDLHYIPLRKDFSNVDEVLARLQDDKHIERLTSRAYEDIIESGLYGYARFIAQVDDFLSIRVRKRQSDVILSVPVLAFDRTSASALLSIQELRHLHLLSDAVLEPTFAERSYLDFFDDRAALVRRISAYEKSLVNDPVLVKPLTLTSSMRFEAGYELRHAEPGSGGNSYAAAMCNQALPHVVEMHLPHTLDVDRIEFLWACEKSRPVKYAVDAFSGRALVQRVLVANNLQLQNVLPMKALFADRFRLTVERYAHERKLELKGVRVYAYPPAYNNKYSIQFRSARSLWRLLPRPLRVTLGPIVARLLHRK